MNKVFLAILWHQHQPYYKDLVTGQMLMPWVRLHGIKDYIGMVDILDEFPSLRFTVNLVPSLMDQIEDYAAGTCTDTHLELARKNAESLEESEIKMILDRFFMANWDHMINVHPRYAELLAMRSFERKTADKVWRKFSAQDLRDLQVWANLAWFHPLVIDRDPFLKLMVAKAPRISVVLAADRLHHSHLLRFHGDNEIPSSADAGAAGVCRRGGGPPAAGEKQGSGGEPGVSLGTAFCPHMSKKSTDCSE